MTEYQKAKVELRPLRFSSRAIFSLVGRGVHTLTDLSKMSERDLAGLPGIGPAALKRFRNYFQKEAPPENVSSKTEFVSIRFSAAVLSQIDAWADGKGNISSRPEAIRQLVELSLTVK